MTRTFKNPEELMIALLNKEKWRRGEATLMYSDGYFKIGNMEISLPCFAIELLCDGKTLWYKVEDKTELDLMEEKYASGDYILVKNTLYTACGYWYMPDDNDRFSFTSFTLSKYLKLIHIKHKEILDAYLADSSVSIEFRDTDGSMKEFEYLSNCLKGSFLDSYNEAFEYRLKPKKKTVS